MEIFGQCTVCGKENVDLIRWQSGQEVWKTEDEVIRDKVTIAEACNDCYNRLESYVINKRISKTNALRLLLKEMSNGKK